MSTRSLNAVQSEFDVCASDWTGTRLRPPPTPLQLGEPTPLQTTRRRVPDCRVPPGSRNAHEFPGQISCGTLL